MSLIDSRLSGKNNTIYLTGHYSSEPIKTMSKTSILWLRLSDMQGLAEHKSELGAPLCPCRHYDDKKMEAAQGFWNCPCVPMRERKVGHALSASALYHRSSVTIAWKGGGNALILDVASAPFLRSESQFLSLFPDRCACRTATACRSQKCCCRNATACYS